MRHRVYTDAYIERFADVSGELVRDNHRERELYKRIVWEAVRTQLTRKQQEALVLYYTEELNVYQIAGRLGIHPSCVSRRLSGARERIRRFASSCLTCLPKPQAEDTKQMF